MMTETITTDVATPDSPHVDMVHWGRRLTLALEHETMEHEATPSQYARAAFRLIALLTNAS